MAGPSETSGLITETRPAAAMNGILDTGENVVPSSRLSVLGRMTLHSHALLGWRRRARGGRQVDGSLGRTHRTGERVRRKDVL
ncbi:hypothetical protein SKAU_G00029790 [Synaphobranchus kaupii]|uniref:Uncharacterized protein n=1 Tax=Synaphobranchus kaupii TaxID=118154 RepID=A0A9Q1GDD2_SYNKA|nr:hypothetical protein SKAU_G00029790 [Synaphobranchus kaupii]